MLRHKTNTLYAIVLFLSLTFLSCKTKKNIPSKDLEDISQETLLDRVLNPQYADFIDAKAKGRIKNTYGTDKGVFYIRMIKDSVIWMAVKRLSIEGGRALINQDSEVRIWYSS